MKPVTRDILIFAVIVIVVVVVIVFLLALGDAVTPAELWHDFI